MAEGETTEPSATPIPSAANGTHATSSTTDSPSNGVLVTPSTLEGDSISTAQPPDNVFQLTVKLPHQPGQTQVTVSSQEQMQDIRQSIVDTPSTFQYSCFHLEHHGKRINDFVELSEVPDIAADPVCELVEDPYTEAQARVHVIRVRELIGASGDRTDLVMGIDAGTSLCDSVELPSEKDANPVAHYDLNAPGQISALLPKAREPAPKTVKSLSLSPWNPPPYNFRMRGHLLYLQATTNEGEQYYITSHVSGFFINKSTNSKFDPTPRVTPKSASAHSLISLLSQISPSFEASFQRLQEYNGQRDPLASYQLSTCIPAAPWLVQASSAVQHQPDLTRTQETYLLAGAENAETLRDWNEEFQSTRELPKETVSDRVFRERLTSKLFAEYNEAAVRGACLVARGEVPPLNPTEAKDAQIFVYNNVFYSFGADGVGTFASDGGDEAARVATGKDVRGVKTVNQLDVAGIFTPGTVVVDYLGKRVVGQSIVPGIFKQREPGEHQIDYGGVEGKDIIASNEAFAKPFSDLSTAMRVKRHPVWDKESKRHDLEASVETKGLLGTDGRKYVLDLYRVTPLDIHWLENHRNPEKQDPQQYPHRMTVLRPELVDSYRILKMREYIAKEMQQVKAKKSDEAAMAEKITEATNGENEHATNGDSETKANGDGEESQSAPSGHVDMSGFSFSLNPDVFTGQQPQTEEEKQELEQDEALVRTVCDWLQKDVLPKFLSDVESGEVGFPMDGQSLVREMHRRGINVRYLGDVASLCAAKEDKRLQALQQLCHRELVSRAFKHITHRHLKTLPPYFAQECIAQLLNCLLGGELNAKPTVEIDSDLKSMYPDIDLTFVKQTPATLDKEIREQIALRYRYKLEGDLVQTGKQIQLLREVALKLGLQLEAKEYHFSKVSGDDQASSLQEKKSNDSLAVPQTNGVHAASEAGKKKNKKKNADHSPNRGASSPISAPHTFVAENILNIVPVVKESAPRSSLAEEALDAGRMSIQQNQKDLGQELLLESLSLHEQIYGILHPEVARVYYALSTLYYSLDEKSAAVELAKKAVIVSERTLGIDHAETVLAYLNLSLFEHSDGKTRNALAYVRHALDLWKNVYGIRHPDSITTINNAAVMLQSLKQFHESRLWFEASLDICTEVSGGDSVNTATLLFQYAQALALDQKTSDAVKQMQSSRNMFKKLLGEEDQNTKEASMWVDTLLQSAVSQQRQAKQLADRRNLLNMGRPSRISMGARPNLPGASANEVPLQQPTSTPFTNGPDGVPVSELVKYIQGESGKQTTPKKKPNNPKRR